MSYLFYFDFANLYNCAFLKSNFDAHFSAPKSNPDNGFKIRTEKYCATVAVAPVLEPHSGPDSGTMLSISFPMLQIFPINSFLYSTCTQAWKQKFGMWRFIATITELTICFSNYRKLHNNIIRYFNYLDIPLKYHNGISFPISINTE